jgi:isoamylase
VDGFRFDLASVLGRDESGNVMPNPPVLWDIESDPALAGTKLIAEAWDAAGLYQVGTFVGDAWKEWNGRFRDDVRSFFRGEEGTVERFADRLLGSPSLYAHKRREPEASVNFVTCHDGFTLNDLVSYDRKHNESNREDNRDGADDNRSWNCGVEGPTDDPGVDRLRTRQVKNFLTMTLLSVGMPMVLMGDEVRRTQGGNNNAYCQDDDTSWFDWTLVAKRADVHRFATSLIAHRVLRDDVYERERIALVQLLRDDQITWHGVELDRPDWSPSSHSLAFTAKATRDRAVFHVLLNAYWEPLSFALPSISGGGRSRWLRWIDTGLDSPDDIVDRKHAPRVEGHTYLAKPRSVVILRAGEP